MCAGASSRCLAGGCGSSARSSPEAHQGLPPVTALGSASAQWSSSEIAPDSARRFFRGARAVRFGMPNCVSKKKGVLRHQLKTTMTRSRVTRSRCSILAGRCNGGRWSRELKNDGEMDVEAGRWRSAPFVYRALAALLPPWSCCGLC